MLHSGEMMLKQTLKNDDVKSSASDVIRLAPKEDDSEASPGGSSAKRQRNLDHHL